MLKLFYFPQLVSMATHIWLEEIGEPYDLQLVDLMKGEHKAPAHLARNPAGQLPALQIDDDVYLTETIAIADYLANTFPQAGLAPAGPLPRARWIATMARIASTFHPTFTRVVRPGMLVEDESAHAAVSTSARARYLAHLDELEALVSEDAWLLGDQYTTADAHALVIYNWAIRAQLPVADRVRLARWKDRMIARPAVRRVLTDENSALVVAA